MLRLLPADCAIALVLWTCIIPLATLDPCDIDISPRDLHNRHPDDKIRDPEKGHNRVLVLFMTTINKGCMLSGDATSGTSTLGLTPLFVPFSLPPLPECLGGRLSERRADAETRDIRNCSKKGSGVVDDRPAFSIDNRGYRAYIRSTPKMTGRDKIENKVLPSPATRKRPSMPPTGSVPPRASTKEYDFVLFPCAPSLPSSLWRWMVIQLCNTACVIIRLLPPCGPFDASSVHLSWGRLSLAPSGVM
ncbi:hypothetical protein V8C44DRAFT_294724 [Trichoderma aethiopicum]